MTQKLLTLQAWLALTYAEGSAPHINTIRRWIKDGKIQPQPEKQGRDFYFTADARYNDGSQPSLVKRMKERMSRGSPSPQPS